MKMINFKYYFYSIFFVIFISACNGSYQNQSGEFTLPEATKAIRVLDLSVPTSSSNDNSEPSTPDISLTPSATLTLINTESFTSTIIPSETPLSCTNKAELIQHLTIPPNVELKPNQYFPKIWRVKNIGTCKWTTKYALVYVGGALMNGPQQVNLPKEVNPGETIDIRVDLSAPATPNTHISQWMLRDERGNLFGVGELADEPLEIIIIIPTKLNFTPAH